MITIVGNSPVDLVAEVPEAFLAEQGLKHGVCTTIPAERQMRLLEQAAWDPIPGGCGANISASLRLLGEQVRLVAPFGNDSYADLTRASLATLDVEIVEHPLGRSGQLVFALLTPDGDRSFATWYDPATCVPAAMLAEAAADAGTLVIDGYVLLHPAYARELLRAVERVDAATNIVFCPNDESVIAEANHACAALVERATHIVSNRRELAGLFPGLGIDAAVSRLAGVGKSGAVTLGSRGALLFGSGESVRIPSALDPADFVDSNGAGDAFTAGYVHGLVRGLPPAEAGVLAARCAAVVLATRGARPPADLARRVA